LKSCVARHIGAGGRTIRVDTVGDAKWDETR
jgi:hypothetical protein